MNQINIEIFKVLADKNRNTIISLLIFTELCVCDIESILEMKQANVSKHMMKLRKENIVEMRKEAQWVYYRLNQNFKENNQHLISYLKEKALEDQSFQLLLKSVNEKEKCNL